MSVVRLSTGKHREQTKQDSASVQLHHAANKGVHQASGGFQHHCVCPRLSLPSLSLFHLFLTPPTPNSSYSAVFLFLFFLFLSLFLLFIFSLLIHLPLSFSSSFRFILILNFHPALTFPLPSLLVSSSHLYLVQRLNCMVKESFHPSPFIYRCCIAYTCIDNRHISTDLRLTKPDV